MSKSLSQLLAEVEPDHGAIRVKRVSSSTPHYGELPEYEHVFDAIAPDKGYFEKIKFVDRASFDKLKAIAVELARALEYNKSKHNEWIDKGHWCDSKKVLQSVVDSSGQALTTARKMLGDE